MENEFKLTQEKLKSSEKYTNPLEFMSRFRASGFYKDAYEAFFLGKNVAAEATEQSKEIAFLQSTKSSDAMLDFYLQDKNYVFNPESFPQTSQEALGEYINFVKEELLHPSRDEIQDRDLKRTQLHMSAGRALVEDNIVPTVRAGRMLARIALVDLRIETPNQARSMR